MCVNKLQILCMHFTCINPSLTRITTRHVGPGGRKFQGTHLIAVLALTRQIKAARDNYVEDSTYPTLFFLMAHGDPPPPSRTQNKHGNTSK
jgi:hypothetical protein